MKVIQVLESCTVDLLRHCLVLLSICAYSTSVSHDDVPGVFILIFYFLASKLFWRVLLSIRLIIDRSGAHLHFNELFLVDLDATFLHFHQQFLDQVRLLIKSLLPLQLQIL